MNLETLRDACHDPYDGVAELSQHECQQLIAEIDQLILKKQAEVLHDLIVEHEIQGIVSWSTRLHQKEDELLRKANSDYPTMCEGDEHECDSQQTATISPDG